MKGGRRATSCYNKERVFRLRAGPGRGRRPEVCGGGRGDQLRLPGHRRHRHPRNPADRRDHLRARGQPALQRDRGRGRPGARRAAGAEVHRGARRQGQGIADVPVPVPYGSAFEGEVVRKADMRVEFGGKYSRCFEYLHMAPLDEVVDGKIEIVGPDFRRDRAAGPHGHGHRRQVAGREMQEDFEPVLERQIHYFVNGASGIQHIGQRDIAWIRVSNAAADKGFTWSTSARSARPLPR
jgi:hypothetical protein